MAEPVSPESVEVLEQMLKKLKDRRLYYFMYQQYYRGNHRLAFATEKFRNAFGRVFSRFQDNVCSTVVDALADRLEIKELVVEDAAGNANDALTKEVKDIWTMNRMDRQSNETHTSALVAGDGYIIVWPDPEDETRPVFYPQEAQTVCVRYDSERPWMIRVAIKCWLDEDEGRTRINLYFPDRIEKYIQRRGGSIAAKATAFERYQPEGETWPLPNPYGIVPVFHFANNAVVGRHGETELYNVVPLQDALNKTVIDMLVAMEFQAFPQRWIAGMEVEYDPITGKPKFPFEPGVDRVWLVGDPETKFGQFDPAQLEQFTKVADSLRLEVARVSGTPLHYFVTITDPPSGEALKTLEQRLIKRAFDRQLGFGCTWQDMMQFAMVIRRRTVDGEIKIKPCWKDPAPRSEKEHAETIEIKKRVGISTDQALKELGYTDEQIKEMTAAKKQEMLDMAEQMLTQFERGEGGGSPYGGGRPRPNPGSQSRGGGA